MTLPVYLRPAAETDVREAYKWLEQESSGLGERFSARLREVFEQIEFMPNMFGAVWRDVRAARLKTFRYLVYYVVLLDRIEVLAVMHGSRNESEWQSRA